MILGRLRDAYFASLTPTTQDDRRPVQRALSETTGHLRIWSVEAVQNLSSDCKSTLGGIKLGPEDGPGLDAYHGVLYASANAQFADANDQVQLGAMIGEIFGGGVFPGSDMTLSEYLGDRFDSVDGVSRRENNLIIINSAKLINHANRSTTYTTLLHEALHLLIPGGHEAVAKKLGIYQDFSQLGNEINDLANSAAIKNWIENCYR